jgi:hypothetical protein
MTSPSGTSTGFRDHPTLTLALDFDGSLVESHSKPLRWRPRAKDFILAASASGATLWLHSCRCASAVALDMEMPGDPEAFWRFGRVPEDLEYSWGLFEEMRAFLEAEGVWGLMQPWTRPGKPIADMYPDDLGERPDWLALAGELGLSLPYAQQGGDRQVVTEGIAAPVAVVSPSPVPAASPGPDPGAAGDGMDAPPDGDLRPGPAPGSA